MTRIKGVLSAGAVLGLAVGAALWLAPSCRAQLLPPAGQPKQTKPTTPSKPAQPLLRQFPARTVGGATFIAGRLPSASATTTVSNPLNTNPLNSPFNNALNSPFNSPFTNNAFNSPFTNSAFNSPFSNSPFANSPFSTPFSSPFTNSFAPVPYSPFNSPFTPGTYNPFANPFIGSPFQNSPYAIASPFNPGPFANPLANPFVGQQQWPMFPLGPGQANWGVGPWQQNPVLMNGGFAGGPGLPVGMPFGGN